MVTISSTIFRRIFFSNIGTHFIIYFFHRIKVGYIMITISGTTFRRIFFPNIGKHFRINFFSNITVGYLKVTISSKTYRKILLPKYKNVWYSKVTISSNFQKNFLPKHWIQISQWISSQIWSRISALTMLRNTFRRNFFRNDGTHFRINFLSDIKVWYIMLNNIKYNFQKNILSKYGYKCLYKFPKNVKVGCLMATMSSKTFRRHFFPNMW